MPTVNRFARSFRYFLVMMPTVLMAGCAGINSKLSNQPISLNTVLPGSPEPRPGGVQQAFLAPGGNYTMVTLRRRPEALDLAESPAVLCTAPSPDWASALALASQFSASGGVSGGASGSLGASGSAVETLTALAGRTAGVVALRDGLYSACQAYANGVIGKDAYALILSQYGNLLVALAAGPAGGAGAGAASAPPSSTPSGVAVAVSTGAPSAGSGSGSGTPGGSAAPSSAGAAALLQMQVPMLEALLVACISENDPTLHPRDAKINPLLDASHGDPGNCKGLVHDVSGQAKTLLSPAPAAPPGGTAKPVKKADAGLESIQKALGIKADGVWGQQTEAAIGSKLGVKSP